MKEIINNNVNILFLALLVGAVAGAIAAFAVVELNEPTTDELIKEFYAVENAVHVSPHGIRKHMFEGDPSYILVDLRSSEEYEEEHIIGALNVPAYSDRFTSAYGQVDRIVNAFKEIVDENPDKDVIIYCYSIPCMTGRKIGNMLAEHDIFVQHLGVGWNEWRYDWTAWNHAHEWNVTDVMDYIATGPDPGEIPTDLTGAGCPIAGEFGC